MGQDHGDKTGAPRPGQTTDDGPGTARTAPGLSGAAGAEAPTDRLPLAAASDPDAATDRLPVARPAAEDDETGGGEPPTEAVGTEAAGAESTSADAASAERPAADEPAADAPTLDEPEAAGSGDAEPETVAAKVDGRVDAPSAATPPGSDSGSDSGSEAGAGQPSTAGGPPEPRSAADQPVTEPTARRGPETVTLGKKPTRGASGTARPAARDGGTARPDDGTASPDDGGGTPPSSTGATSGSGTSGRPVEGLPQVLSTETPGPMVRPPRQGAEEDPASPPNPDHPDHPDRPSHPDDHPEDDDERELLSGRYRLDSVVGRGGMGTVWRATDEMLGRTVAVKELRLPSNVDDGERQRLVTRTLREAKAIAAIRSQGVVTIYDVIDDGTRPWIVMELIEGRALSDIVGVDGPLDATRVAEIGLDVLEVLAAAHRVGIVHRDVKPSNVLIAHADGRVVLTDFGIAKVDGESSITSTGMLVGAPSYISPERAWGGGLSPAADLWSLGALLYCALVGRAPHDQGGAIATLTSVMNDPVELPEGSGPLGGVIEGLLRKDPTERFDERITRTRLRAVVDGTAETSDGAGSADEPENSSTTVVLGPGASGDAAARSGRGAVAESGSEAGTEPRAALPATPAQPLPLPGVADADGDDGQDATPVRPVPVPVPAGEFGPAASPDGEPGASDEGKEGGTAPTAFLGDGVGGPNPPAGDAAGGGGGRRRRRTLLLAALGVVVVALVAALVVPRISGGDDPDPGPDVTDEPTQEPTDDSGDSGESGDSDESDESDGSGGEDGEPDPEETGDDGSGDGEEPDSTGPPGVTPDRDPDSTFPPENPEGFSRQVSAEHRFSVSLPDGWAPSGTVVTDGTTVYTGPSGDLPSVRVDFTDEPGEDAADDWRAEEEAARDRDDDYERIALDSVEWRDYPTVADWEFERTESGERVRVLNRGFRVNGDRGYAIMVTCVADEWDGNDCRTLRETVHETFTPLE